MVRDLRVLATRRDILDFCDRLAEAKEIALDTEFHGEKSYWPKLMLLQIATRSEVVIVDPLAPEVRTEMLAALLAAIRMSGALVVGHAIGNDLEILSRATSDLPARVFDTQVAASFLGLGLNVGLARLLSARLNIEVEKQYSMADWSKRPLSSGQLEYAAVDVLHLLPLLDDLRDELSRRARLEWVEEESARLLDPTRYQPRAPELAWKSIRKGVRPGTREALVMRELATERERIAMEHDLPRQFILPDELLVDLARRAPPHEGALQGDTHRRTSPGLKQHAKRWLAAIERGRQSTVAEEAAPIIPALPPSQEGLVALARTLTTWHALRADIAPPLLLSQLEELADLLRAPPRDRAEFDARLGLTGWRADLIGEPLWALLSGGLHATVVQGPDGLELAWSPASPSTAAARA